MDNLTAGYLAYRDQKQAAEMRAAGDRALLQLGIPVALGPDPTSEEGAARMAAAQQRLATEAEGGPTGAQTALTDVQQTGVRLTPPDVTGSQIANINRLSIQQHDAARRQQMGPATMTEGLVSAISGLATSPQADVVSVSPPTPLQEQRAGERAPVTEPPPLRPIPDIQQAMDAVLRRAVQHLLESAEGRGFIAQLTGTTDPGLAIKTLDTALASVSLFPSSILGDTVAELATQAGINPLLATGLGFGLTMGAAISSPLTLANTVSGTRRLLTGLKEARAAYLETQIPRIADQLEKSLAERGGFSYSLHYGTELSPKRGFAVSVVPEIETTIPGRATKADIEAFIAKNRELLDDRRLAVGGWYDAETNQTYLDGSILTTDANTAHDAGRLTRQKAIYDAEKQASEPVRYEGFPPPPEKLPPIEERLRLGKDLGEFLDQPQKPTVRVFHGTGQSFDKASFEQGRGLFVAEDPSVASRYAELAPIRGKGEAPNVRPYELATDARMMPGEEYYKLAEAEGFENLNALNKRLREQGYDGVAFPPDASGKGQHYLVLNPEKLIEPFTGEPAARLGLLGAAIGAGAIAATSDSESRDPYAGTALIGIVAAGTGNLPLLKALSSVQKITRGSKYFNALASVGAAKIFFGARSEKQFAEAMIKEFGDIVRPHLDELFKKSQAIAADHLEPLRDKMSAFKEALDAWREAKGLPYWYGPQEKLKQLMGPDARLMAGLIAATSPGAKAATDNLDAAIAAYRIIKTKPESEWRAALAADPAIRRGDYGAEARIPNIIRAAKGEPLQGNKVSDFFDGLMGIETVTPIDRHMVPIVFNKLTKEEATALASKLNDPKYAVASEWVKEFARRRGVTPTYGQQRLWMGDRIRRFLLDGNEPIYDMLEKRIAENPDILDLIPKEPRLMDEAGRIRVATMARLGEIAAGAVLGAQFGEDPEERLRNAFAGAGIVGLSAPLIRKIAGFVMEEAPRLRNLVRAGKPTAEASPYPPEIQQQLDRLFARYDELLAAARRGERPHAQALLEAEQMIRQGRMTLEDIKALRPGTAMNDSEAMALIKVINEHGTIIQDRARDLVSRIEQGTLSPGDVDSFLAHLFTMRELLPKQAGVVAEAGRTLSAMNAPTSEWNLYLRQWQKLFSDPGTGLTPERLIRTIAAFDDPVAIARLSNDLSKPGWDQIAIELLYGHLLQAPQTHVVNSLTTLGAMLWSPIERAGAALVGDTVHWSEPIAMIAGWLHALPLAFRYAKKTLLEGVQTIGSGGKIEAQANAAITPENLGRLLGSSWAGRLADVLIGASEGALAGYGTSSGLGFSDQRTEGTVAGALMGAAIGGGRMTRLAMRALMTEDEFIKTLDYWAQRYALAARAGFAESDPVRRAKVIHEILNEAPHAIHDNARRFAEEFTWTSSPGPLLSKVIEGINDLPGPYKVMVKAVAPFINVPAQLLKFAAKRMPVLQQLHAGWVADLSAGGARRDTALGQLVLGASAISMLASAAMAGIITGSGPGDPNIKREWLADGNQEYALNIGNKSISINRADPFGMLMGLVADWVAISAHIDEATNDQIAMALLMAVSKDMMSKSYLSGPSSFLEAVTQKDPNASYRYLSTLVGTPVPGLIRSARWADDPALREARTLIEQVKSKIVGFSPELPPLRNIFAQPIPRHEPLGYGLDFFNPFTVKTIKRDPAANALIENRISAKMPGWFIYGNAARQWSLDPQRDSVGIELSPQLRDELIQLIGKPLHEAWTQYVQSREYQQDPSEGPDSVKARVFHQLYDRFRKQGVAQLMERHPELQAKLEDLLRRRAAALTGG